MQSEISGFYPMPSTSSTQNHDHPSTVLSSISEYDAEILQNDAFILSLMTANAGLKVRRNDLLLVNRLPNEVLGKIFLYCTHGWPLLATRNPWVLDIAPAWIQLTYVCSRWRQVALGYSELWCNIQAGIVSPWIERFMERAFPRLVNVELVVLNPNQMETPTIISHISRIRRLNLEGLLDSLQSFFRELTRPIPSLELLSISGRPDGYPRPDALVPTVIASCLSTLDLGDHCWIEDNSTSLPSLQHLSVYDVSLTQLHRLLQRTPQLLSIDIQCLKIRASDVEAKATSLSHLQSLHAANVDIDHGVSAHHIPSWSLNLPELKDFQAHLLSSILLCQLFPHFGFPSLSSLHLTVTHDLAVPDISETALDRTITDLIAPLQHVNNILHSILSFTIDLPKQTPSGYKILQCFAWSEADRGTSKLPFEFYFDSMACDPVAFPVWIGYQWPGRGEFVASHGLRIFQKLSEHLVLDDVQTLTLSICGRAPLPQWLSALSAFRRVERVTMRDCQDMLTIIEALTLPGGADAASAGAFLFPALTRLVIESLTKYTIDPVDKVVPSALLSLMVARETLNLPLEWVEFRSFDGTWCRSRGGCIHEVEIEPNTD
ncbi:hypothetical protein HETIRDRAFT_165593 [Heterobasidion irregulare TC 32-1]|uniref:Uncharacterized protein n=1 Tax=Heterobasidion irregulare (strain TC 32-1) TaxID=747525 RepID=W4JXW3_HETIT|nr:uncharacterized protein HETIRDRAFT_165593 [Heterobasidion irregulare TC 32-1]ETW78417.1 hypothetical protein HETIRDRAFT_165593 [Heterobasidion irregulare TC 32-1]